MLTILFEVRNLGLYLFKNKGGFLSCLEYAEVHKHYFCMRSAGT